MNKSGFTPYWRAWRRSERKLGLSRTEGMGVGGAGGIVPGLDVPWRRDEPGELESFRRLALNLCYLRERQPVQAVVMTSAVPGEGKSSITLNLAVALADLGHTTIVMETDLRKPDLHTMLGLFEAPGLSEWMGGDMAEPPLVETAHKFHFLPCGKDIEEPMSLLASPQFSSLLNRLCERANFVLLDSPPILAFADGLTLATLAGAAILVVRSGTVTRREAQQAVGRLRDVGANVLGVALNDVTPEHYHRYYRQNQRNGYRQIQ